MIIYKENTSESNILPPIRSSQNEITQTQNSLPQLKTDQYEESQYKNSITDRNTYNNGPITIDPNQLSNNRYSENDIEKINDKDNLSHHTSVHSRTITTDNVLERSSNPYIAKVELQNLRSIEDCIYLLEEYFKAQNKQPYYETFSDQDKFIISFDDEKTAFDFTKIIYTEKSKNALYKNVLVHLSLSPNQNYIKKQKSENKKRGISLESIMKLYNGSSYTRRVKEKPKIYTNIILGIKSPFYNVNDRKNKINSMKKLKNNRFDRNINNVGDRYGYVGYDGQPLKNYEKLRISVLDTHYKPISEFKYREDDKKKWVSPSNFIC
jgi:hypothetical protein